MSIFGFPKRALAVNPPFLQAADRLFQEGERHLDWIILIEIHLVTVLEWLLKARMHSSVIKPTGIYKLLLSLQLTGKTTKREAEEKHRSRSI